MKALTLQEAKEKVAVKYGFKDWKELIRNTLIQGFDRLHDEAALLYSKSRQEALITELESEKDKWEKKFEDTAEGQHGYYSAGILKAIQMIKERLTPLIEE